METVGVSGGCIGDQKAEHRTSFSGEATSARMPSTLIDLLSNSLVLRQTAPYLPLTSLYALLATSKSLYAAIAHSPEARRYLDLSPIKNATFDSAPIDSGGVSWRSQRMDEALTEDEFYSGPLRGIMARLARQSVLGHISTMILDGLTVPTEMVREIVCEDRFNVRILSIREVKHLNERKLMQVLKYAVRASRRAGTPKLKGLYVFGPMQKKASQKVLDISRRRSLSRNPDPSPDSVTSALGAQLGAEWNKKSQEALTTDLCGVKDKWYQPTGPMFTRSLNPDWAETIKACQGIVHFDAILCRGPRHDPQNYADKTSDTATNLHNSYLPPKIATVALGPEGCSKCKSCPEQPAVFGHSPSHQLPLLAPPPLHSSSIRAAQWPEVQNGAAAGPKLYARCTDCLKGRWCEQCHKWWDESCYMPIARTEPQNGELAQWQTVTVQEQSREQVKVYNGFCVETCLVGELMLGEGSGGMWG